MRTKCSIFLLFTGLLFATLASCSQREVYARFHHIERGEWCRDSLLLFTIDSLPPAATYDVMVELTTNRGYPYRDIWLQIDHDLADSLVRTDTLRCLLADGYGKWLGSGAGGLNQLSLLYRSFIPRDSLYSYHLSIRQVMADGVLRGVEKVGVKVERPDGTNQ